MARQVVVPAYRRYVLGLLLTIFSVNYMDRQIIAVLSPQIKGALALNDTQLGLLKGTAFALFYSTVAIPLALLGDRTNRVRLIAGSLVLWSVATAFCGAAESFSALFMLRMVVGVGEAGSTPSSHSLLADYFDRAKRSTALAIYSLGVPAGTLLGLSFGGWLSSRFGWRWTFAALGAPGVLLAIVALATLRERPRGAMDAAPSMPGQPRRFLAGMRHILAIPSYRTMVISGSLNAFAGYAVAMWMIDFYTSSRPIGIAEIAPWMALAFGIGGGVGTLVGGVGADRLARRGSGHYLTIPALALILSGPAMLGCAFSASLTVSIACLFAVNGLTYASFGPLYGLVQTLVPARDRALAVSLYFLFQSLIGAGLGPLAVGAASDLLSAHLPRSEALAISLGALAVPLLAGGVILWLGRTRLTIDLARAG